MIEPKVCLYVARGRNGVIGRDGDLPWRLGDDLRLFKARTLGKPVVMGRKTWESLPKAPLPGRPNIVVSRNWAFRAPGARVYSSLETALAVACARARHDKQGEVFVIGGASLYERALARTQRMYIAEVDAAPDGDVRFPDFDPQGWDVVSREAFDAGGRNEFAFELTQLERRKG